MIIRWIIAVLSMLLSFNGVAWGAGGKWVKVYDGPEGSYFVHSDMAYEDGTVKVWTKMNYSQPQFYLGEQYLTDQTRFEYDCKGEWMARLAGIKATRHEGQGKVILNTIYDNPMRFPITPNNHIYDAVKKLCDWNQKK